jgi:sialic acid synthase SpsE
VYIIAEAGINHGGDIAVARRMVAVAAQAGADAVKFQSFTAKGLTHAGLARDQHEFFAKYELGREEHVQLAAACREHGADFLSTPFDFAMVDLLEDLGVRAFKIASSDLTFLPLIEYAAAKGKPMYISTGMGDTKEARAAFEAARRAGAPRVVLLQCTTNYPAAYADVNLRAMHTLRAEVGAEVGFSDHSIGNYCCFAAAALGASVIEKHFCLDKAQSGPDILCSADPAELTDLVRGIRCIEEGLGTGEKAMAESEREVAAVARRSIYYAAALPAGHVLTRRDFVFLRPGTGMSPAQVDALLGKPLTRAVTDGAPAALRDVE